MQALMSTSSVGPSRTCEEMPVVAIVATGPGQEVHQEEAECGMIRVCVNRIQVSLAPVALGVDALEPEAEAELDPERNRGRAHPAAVYRVVRARECAHPGHVPGRQASLGARSTETITTAPARLHTRAPARLSLRLQPSQIAYFHSRLPPQRARILSTFHVLASHPLSPISPSSFWSSLCLPLLELQNFDSAE